MNNRWAFDIEVFQNFFSATFVNIETKDVMTFIIWKKQNERDALLSFLRESPFLVSYNGISYDLPILRYIINHKGKNINSDIYKLSHRLISDSSRRDEDIMALRYPREEDFIHLDLMSMLAFNKTGVGLKQCSVNLQWHRIQDLPLPYDHVVREEDVPLIMDYNLNDVLITIKLYESKDVAEARLLRESLVGQFGNRILSASKSTMANIFLESMYENATGISKKEFKQQRTPRDSVKFSDIILPMIRFKTKELQDLRNEISSQIVYSYDDFKFTKSFAFYGNIYNFGIGGLHTDEKPALYDETSTSKILTMDVSSFYPAIMCEYGVKPEHVEYAFIEILDKIRKERLVAKKAKDNVKAESYKIVVNSTFGKLGDSNYWLYDPMALIKVTLNGQLFLMMLIEKMELAGIHCISGNTDGIEVIVPTEKIDECMVIAKEWERETKFSLEFLYYKRYVKRDVNNYCAITTDGKKKVKGVFLDSIDLSKGYKSPIIPRAVNQYFVNGTPVEQTIKSCKNILDFCISQKSAKEFTMELKTLSGTQTLQKTNRFFISNFGGGFLQKRHSDGRVIGLYTGKIVSILNDYDANKPFHEYNVNLGFYIKEAKDLISEIEPEASQATLFEMNQDFGKRTDFLGKEIVKKKGGTPVSKKITEEEIRSADKKKIKYDVPPSLSLVVDINTKYTPTVTFYSLSKGTKATFKIDKKLFGSNPLLYGDVVSLDGFEKRPRYKKEGADFIPVPGEFVWWVTQYKKIDDFSKFKRKVAIDK